MIIVPLLLFSFPPVPAVGNVDHRVFSKQYVLATPLPSLFCSATVVALPGSYHDSFVQCSRITLPFSISPRFSPPFLSSPSCFFPQLRSEPSPVRMVCAPFVIGLGLPAFDYPPRVPFSFPPFYFFLFLSFHCIPDRTTTGYPLDNGAGSNIGNTKTVHSPFSPFPSPSFFFEQEVVPMV